MWPYVRWMLCIPASLCMAVIGRILSPILPFFVEDDGYLPDWLSWFQTPDNPADGDPSCNHRYFYEYDAPLSGEGRFIHTYQENLDPLPSFEGEPRRVSISAPDAQTLAKEVWENLNEDNKVSLYVSYIDLASGQADTVIINKHQ